MDLKLKNILAIFLKKIILLIESSSRFISLRNVSSLSEECHCWPLHNCQISHSHGISEEKKSQFVEAGGATLTVVGRSS